MKFYLGDVPLDETNAAILASDSAAVATQKATEATTAATTATQNATAAASSATAAAASATAAQEALDSVPVLDDDNNFSVGAFTANTSATVNGPLTTTGAITAGGGVVVPAPTTNDNPVTLGLAKSHDALIRPIIQEYFDTHEDCSNLYKNATDLTSFSYDLSKVTNTDGMFWGAYISSFSGSLAACTNGFGMFRGSKVTEVTITEHQMTSLYTFIYGASLCKKVTMDMTNITSLSYFGERSGLIEFKHNLKNVTNCNNAFMGIAALTEFNCELPNCTVMSNCFNWDSSLTTCRYPIDADGACIYDTGNEQATDDNGDLKWAYLTLPKVYEAYDAFAGCKLDKPTVLSILNSLQTKDTAIGNSSRSWDLHSFGIDKSLQNDTEVLQAIEDVQDKNWGITVQWK